MEGKPFRVHFVSINSETKGVKKTLVLTHGLFGNIACFGHFLDRISQHYHVVLFENCSWGLNSKVEDSEALQSVDKTHEWFSNFMIRTMDALTEHNHLPEKFFMSGHSYGGYLCGLYASL